MMNISLDHEHLEATAFLLISESDAFLYWAHIKETQSMDEFGPKDTIALQHFESKGKYFKFLRYTCLHQ